MSALSGIIRCTFEHVRWSRSVPFPPWSHVNSRVAMRRAVREYLGHVVIKNGELVDGVSSRVSLAKGAVKVHFVRRHFSAADGPVGGTEQPSAHCFDLVARALSRVPDCRGRVLLSTEAAASRKDRLLRSRPVIDLAGVFRALVGCIQNSCAWRPCVSWKRETQQWSCAFRLVYSVDRELEQSIRLPTNPFE